MLVKNLLLVPRNIAIALLLGYRAIISPLYGDVCKYYPSCSRYALEAYQKHHLLKATALTAWRLLRCNPFSNGGVNDVPKGKNNVQLSRLGFISYIARQGQTSNG